MDPARKSGPLAKLAPGAPGDPAEFGPYLLFGLIARGGMAEVYRAREKTAIGPANLAIKVMRPQLAKEARFIEMFIREGKLAMMLSCEAIVRTLDVGEVDGRYFIAMDYIGGKDLTQVLRRCQESNQRIPVPHAIAIAASICEGLEFAHALTDAEGHSLSLVNRDVSPSNVRVGYDGRVKLLDFGIAQALLKFTSEIGVLKGKFSYMSPEQIRGLPVDARTDIFSTGIILHETLTTEKLFRGDTEFALMEKVRNAEVAPPSKFNRRVSAELDRICMKALARDLPDRYQTARELREDLLRLLESYKYRPVEMEEFIRGLFRADLSRELEEQRASQSESVGSAEIVHEGGDLSSDMEVLESGDLMEPFRDEAAPVEMPVQQAVTTRITPKRKEPLREDRGSRPEPVVDPVVLERAQRHHQLETLDAVERGGPIAPAPVAPAPSVAEPQGFWSRIRNKLK